MPIKSVVNKPQVHKINGECFKCNSSIKNNEPIITKFLKLVINSKNSILGA